MPCYRILGRLGIWSSRGKLAQGIQERKWTKDVRPLTILTRNASLEYAAPESLPSLSTGALEQVDSKADMWSLGMILHMLLFFRLPYQYSSYGSKGALIKDSRGDAKILRLLETEVRTYRGLVRFILVSSFESHTITTVFERLQIIWGPSNRAVFLARTWSFLRHFWAYPRCLDQHVKPYCESYERAVYVFQEVWERQCLITSSYSWTQFPSAQIPWISPSEKGFLCRVGRLLCYIRKGLEVNRKISPCRTQIYRLLAKWDTKTVLLRRSLSILHTGSLRAKVLLISCYQGPCLHQPLSGPMLPSSILYGILWDVEPLSSLSEYSSRFYW